MNNKVGEWSLARLVVTFCVVFALGGGSARAQQYSQDTRSYFDYGEPFYTSMVQSADGRSMDVRVNTSSSMFSFLRVDPSKVNKGKFYAIREVTVEVVERGFTAALLSKTVTDTLYVTDYKLTTAKDNWHAMSERVALPTFDNAKKYAVRVEIRDGVLSRLAMRPVIADLRNTPLQNTADSNGIGISDITLLDSINGSSVSTKARGNTYMFSRDVNGVVSFKLADVLSDNAVVEVSVKQLTNLVDPESIGDRGHVTIAASDMHANQILEFVSSSSNLNYKLVPTSDPRVWTAFFTVPGKAFEQGKYQFSVRVRSGVAERTRTNDFTILWQDMPLSLEDPADAVQPLVHILKDDQVQAIKMGSKQEVLKKIYQYWKKQDPTPGTAYNERMAAFYQRVDYADFNFATTHALDGVMTDRGRIYLLYGAPSHVERTFIPGESPVETWDYSNNVKRQFRFEDRGAHGDYKLTEVKNMAAMN